MGNKLDLKIELRKLFALHEAAIRLEHAVRETNQKQQFWRDFSPSRFIYAFFTFNSIYSFDWESSFKQNQIQGWQKSSNDKYPSEEEQYKSYIKFTSNKLGDDISPIFKKKLDDILELLQIKKPFNALKSIDIVNADRKLKSLGNQFPGRFRNIQGGQSKDFSSDLFSLLHFVYKVRCNLFHGRKTDVQLLEAEQQDRFKIYTALLISTNNLLFEVTNKAHIGWKEVDVNFQSANIEHPEN